MCVMQYNRVPLYRRLMSDGCKESVVQVNTRARAQSLMG